MGECGDITAYFFFLLRMTAATAPAAASTAAPPMMYGTGLLFFGAISPGSAVAASAVALCFVFYGLYGFAPMAAGVFYLLFVLRGVKALGGMSGDVSGHALCVGELCAVAVFALL